MAKRAKILGAKADACNRCGGIVYKLLTSIGIVYQCKCGNTYQNR